MKFKALHPLADWHGLVMQVTRIGDRLFAVGGLGADGQIMRSDDDGDTWTATKWRGTKGRGPWGAMPTDRQHGLRQIWGDASMGREGTLHAVGEYGAVLVSRDFGETWEAEKLSGTGCMFGVVGRGDSLYIAGDDGIKKRKKTARAWKKIDVTTGLCRFWSLPSSGDLMVAGDHGVLLRVDKDDQVTHVNMPASVKDADANLYGFCALDDKNWIVVGAKGLVLVTDDAGASFQTVPSDCPHDLFAVVRVHDELVVAVGHKGSVLASTAGRRWQAQPAPKKGIDLWGACSAGDGKLYIAGQAGHAWRATL